MASKPALTPFDTSAVRQRIERGPRAKWWCRTGTKARGFRYVDAQGEPIIDDFALARIQALVIPPAWKFVRIAPKANHKLQALGMDAAGRIQYLYHSRFAEKQQTKKFQKIEKFGEHLPQLRKITNEHLTLDGFPREKVLAVMLRLINSLYIRVGTEGSAKRYKTYGITTLQNRHLEIGRGGKLVFRFVGKHHVKHRKVLVDEELAAALKELKMLGTARRLFHYVDETGRAKPIAPREINGYLKAVTAPEFSVKDFRTWGGTILAAVALAEVGSAPDERQRNLNLASAIKKIAVELGNTPSVCRGAYIHPAVIRAYHAGVTLAEFRPRRARRISRYQTDFEPEEAALLKMFQSRSL